MYFYSRQLQSTFDFGVQIGKGEKGKGEERTNKTQQDFIGVS